MSRYNEFPAGVETIEVVSAARPQWAYPQQPRKSASRTVWIVMRWISLGVMMLLAALIGLVAVFGSDKEIKLKGGSQLLYPSSVQEAEARKLADWLDANFPYPQQQVSFRLSKNGTAYEFRMIAKPGKEKDPAVIALGQALETAISKTVYDGAAVNVFICDDHFNTLTPVPHAEAPKTAEKK